MTTQESAPTRYLEANGVRYAHRIVGEMTVKEGARPLLMLNHVRSTIDLWDPALINSLVAGGRQLITVDYPGLGHTGGSVPPTIKGFAAGIISFLRTFSTTHRLDTPFDVLGFSLGGYVAQQLVLDVPELVHRLVLSGTGPSLGPGLERPKSEVQTIVFADPASAPLANAVFFPAIVSNLGEAWLGRSFSSRAKIAGKDGEPEVAAFTSGPQLQALIGAYLSWDSDPVPYSLLSTIQKDVLVTIGQNDLVVPSRNGYVLAQQLQRASLIQYPRSGHGHIFQYAEKAARHIGDFLDGKDLVPS